MKTTMSQGETVSHTPGPWALETVKTQVGICHKIGPFPPARANDEPSHACIYVDGRYKATDDPESLANARLIAAAPDLLSACSRAYYSLCKVAGTESEYRVMAPELLIESLKSALAKAGATITQKEGAK